MRPPTGGIFTILTDVLLQLVVLFIAMLMWLNMTLTSSQAVASQVPGMEKRLEGLEGQLEKGKRELVHSHRNGDRLRSIIDGKDRQIGDLHDTVGQLTVDNGVLRSRIRSGDPVTVVVMIDTTASMTEPIAMLRSSMVTLFEFMPNLSKQFSVGICAFRNGVVARYPVTPILPMYQDNGESQQALLSFLNSLGAQQAYTNHQPVFDEALKMFATVGKSRVPNLKERLIFLGDVGTSELDQTAGYTATERGVANQILKKVRTWALQEDRAVEALYVTSATSMQDPSADESRAWFKSLGNVSRKSAFYTDTNALLRAILHASLE